MPVYSRQQNCAESVCAVKIASGFVSPEHNHMIINQQDAFVWDIKTQVCCAFAAYGEAQVVACRSSA
jgi:hypothetical protein